VDFSPPGKKKVNSFTIKGKEGGASLFFLEKLVNRREEKGGEKFSILLLFRRLSPLPITRGKKKKGKDKPKGGVKFNYQEESVLFPRGEETLIGGKKRGGHLFYTRGKGGCLFLSEEKRGDRPLKQERKKEEVHLYSGLERSGKRVGRHLDREGKSGYTVTGGGRFLLFVMSKRG